MPGVDTPHGITGAGVGGVLHVLTPAGWPVPTIFYTCSFTAFHASKSMLLRADCGLAHRIKLLLIATTSYELRFM